MTSTRNANAVAKAPGGCVIVNLIAPLDLFMDALETLSAACLLEHWPHHRRRYLQLP
jgi:hypothetical protein